MFCLIWVQSWLLVIKVYRKCSSVTVVCDNGFLYFIFENVFMLMGVANFQ